MRREHRGPFGALLRENVIALWVTCSKIDRKDVGGLLYELDGIAEVLAGVACIGAQLLLNAVDL